MKVLVTGAGGFVGTVLIPQLLGAGHTVTALDLEGRCTTDTVAGQRYQVFEGNMTDGRTLPAALDGADAVVHLAGLVGYPACHRQPELAVEANLQATEALIAARQPDQLVVLSSTESVYGPIPGGFCVETAECRPTSIYGQTKLGAEAVTLAGGQSIVLRFPSAFGVSSRMRWDLLVNGFVALALTEGRLELYEPHVGRSFCHVTDMARALEFAIAHRPEMVGGVFNVGDRGLNITKAELVDEIEASLDIDLEVTHSDAHRDAERRDYVMSFDRLNALGYRTTVDLGHGIREVAAAHRAGQGPT